MCCKYILYYFIIIIYEFIYLCTKKGPTASGNTCLFTCQNGYTATGTSTCLAGSFTSVGTCVAKACPTPPVIANSATVCTSSTPSGSK